MEENEDIRDIREAVRDLQGEERIYGVTPFEDPFADMMTQMGRQTEMVISAPVFAPEPTTIVLADSSPDYGDAFELEDQDDEWLPTVPEPEAIEPMTDPLRPRMLPIASAEDDPHNLLSIPHGDTVAAAAVAGDVIRSAAAGVWSRYGKETNGDIFTLTAGLPVWAAPTTFAWYGHTLISADDTTAGLLETKIIDGTHTTVTVTGGPGDERLKVDHNTEGATDQTITITGAGTITGSGTVNVDALGHTTDSTKTITLTGAAGTNALLDASAHTDTAADAVTQGSLIYGNATPKWDELAISVTDGAVLTSNGTIPTWNIPTGHDPWIAVSASAGVLDINHAGPGGTCHNATVGVCAHSIMDIDIDEFGHVRFIQLCGYSNYGDGDCVGPCGDAPS